MKLSNLENKHVGEIIYIVGTGFSAEFIPKDLFDIQNSVTIGLNCAYQLFPNLTYNLTIHPELIPRDTTQTWITKHKHWLDKNKSYPKIFDKQFYFFRNNQNIHDYKLLYEPQRGYLYVGRGIHTAACHLASYMGATIAVLVGVDMLAVTPKCDSGANLTQSDGCQNDSNDPTYIYYQSVNKTVNFHGLNPVDVCKEYYLSLQAMRKYLPNLQILSLIPYTSAEYWREEYLTMKKDPPTKLVDESTYIRDSIDF